MKIVCPNCKTSINIDSSDVLSCTSENCDYKFKVFKKKDEDSALDFYITKPSKSLKYKIPLDDQDILIAFCEEVQPFIVNNIFDLIDHDAIQTIQIGLSQKLKRPMSIYVQINNEECNEVVGENGIEILNAEGNIFGRVNPIVSKAYFCDYCKRIRETEEGEKSCTNYDQEIALNLVDSDFPVNSAHFCWAGLIDIAIPVVINNIVIAIFTTGQLILDFEKIRSTYLPKVNQVTKIPIVDLEKLLKSRNKYKIKSFKELRLILSKISDQVKLITDIAENRFWAERRVREADFLSEIFASFAAIDDNKYFWKVLEMIMKRVNSFSGFQYSGLYLNEPDFKKFFPKIKAGLFGIDKPVIFSEEILETYSNFSRSILVKEQNIVKQSNFYESLKGIFDSEINCLLLFPFSFNNTKKGFLFFANRVFENKHFIKQGSISSYRTSFIERICHEIVIQLSNHRTLVELNDSIKNLNIINAKLEKAEKIREHEMKAPLGSIIANTNFVIKNLYEPSATSKLKRLEEILEDAEICSFLFKETKIPKRDDFLKVLTDASPRKLIDEVLKFIEREILRRSILQIKNSKEHLEYQFELFPFIETCCEGNSSNIAIHPYLLKRAFYNLGINAVKYAKSEGGFLKIRVFEKNNFVNIIFSDNGLGIDIEDVPHIFKDGYRGKNVLEKHHGEGLGLGITKRIIEAHYGKIEVTSNRNPTSFRIELPISKVGNNIVGTDYHIIRKDNYIKKI